MATSTSSTSPDNGEIFLANSKGWREEAEAVINDVKDHVKLIQIADALENSDNSVYLNITTVEDLKLTVELSCQGFLVVSKDGHNLVPETATEVDESNYFETPYSLLDKISPGYRHAFGTSLANQLRKLSQN